MADYPIIFSAPMILALLAGRKTQTRRLAWRDVKLKPKAVSAKAQRFEVSVVDGTIKKASVPSQWQKLKEGDRLWVKENFALDGCGRKVGVGIDTWPNGYPIDRVRYIATDKAPAETARGEPYWWNQRPSIHMPRWASRITLMVTANKIERLADISEADAMAEGIERFTADFVSVRIPGMFRGRPEMACETAREAYFDLWNWLHGEHADFENPEVVAPSFKVEKRNIDAERVAA